MTGGSGFLGSWICRLLARDHNVTALLRVSSSSYRLSNITNLQVLRSDPEVWPDMISQIKPDVLILCDWWGAGNQERNDTRQFENVERISTLVESARDANVKVIIGVGSQAELGPVADVIYEIQQDGPTTEYGKAKVQARELAIDATVGSRTRFAWLRIFSTYGPLDEGNWLIPSIVDSLAKGESVDLTLGEQEWSYLHAFDLARAFKTVMENETISGIVNVGNPATLTIRSAAELISSYFDAQSLLKFGAIPYRPDQVMRLKPACETLIAAGWYPQVEFKNGITETIDWLLKKQERPLVTGESSREFFNLPIRR